MPPIKFQLNLTLFRITCRLKNSKMATVATLFFSNSESLCHCDASHQVLAQSNLLFGLRCRLKKFKMAGGHLGYQNGTISAILNLYVAPMPPIKFQLTLTYGLGDFV